MSEEKIAYGKHIEGSTKVEFDLNKIIDSVREKKDCRVHIFITDTTTSISVEPLTDDRPRWIEDSHGYRCSECGWWSDLQQPYCHTCGEKLTHVRLNHIKKLGGV